MPNALISLPDVTETVTLRVAHHVIEQLSAIMSLPENTQVLLPGYTDTVPMNGGDFNTTKTRDFPFPNDSKLVVTFNEEVDESYTLTTPVNMGEHRPLFHDITRDITLTPVYRYVTMNVTIEYTAQNQALIQRWIDQQRSRISMGRAELYLDLEYSFALPDAVHYLLMELHKQMLRVAPIEQTDFSQYFYEYTTVPLSVVETLAGTAPRVVYPEHQYEVLGWFDFTTSPPEAERQEGSGAWSSTFNFQLRYNRPVQIYCQYPILVHQQIIDARFRPKKKYTTYADELRRVSQTKGALDRFRFMDGVQGLGFLQLPEVDDWEPQGQRKERTMFMSTLCSLSEQDPYSLLDLKELGGFALDEAVVEYLTHQGDRIFDAFTSVLDIVLYVNTERSAIPLTLDGTMIKATRALDLQRYHHLVFSLRRNWVSLPTETTQDLRRYPRAIWVLLKALGVSLGGGDYDNLDLLGPGRPRPGALTPGAQTGDGPQGLPPENGIVRNEDLRDAVNQTDRDHFKVDRVGPMTVMTSKIITLKNKDR